MTDFEVLLRDNKTAVFTFISYKIQDRFDAEDVYQETVSDAFRNFGKLHNKEAFRAWILKIARNKVNDYYRRNYKDTTVFFDDIKETESGLMYGSDEAVVIRDILDGLSYKHREIIELSYIEGRTQEDISKLLGIPLGTVKSRQASAKKSFMMNYSDSTDSERKKIMKKLPDLLPAYNIRSTEKISDFVILNELQGLSIIPELNEKSSWGIYDYQTGKCREYSYVEVVGKAQVHGIDGVEISSERFDVDKKEKSRIQFIAQKTDTHIRYLSESHMENGIRKCYTFLDGDIFMNNWGFGEDNIGVPVKITGSGIIERYGDTVIYQSDVKAIDITGDYEVEINGKKYETVCVMILGHFNGAVAIEQYIDKNGRTVLWRRFNRDDWAFSRNNKLWSEILPENERLLVNGKTYVHWCDSITDYIL